MAESKVATVESPEMRRSPIDISRYNLGGADARGEGD